MKRLNSGFSLIELLVVIAVLSILLSIGVINLRNVMQTQRLSEVSSMVAENLKQAANEARLESRFVQVNVASNKLTWVYSSDNTTVKEADLAYGASISPTNPSLFTGRGLPQAAQTYTVSLNGKSKNVYLLPTGAVILR